MKLTSREVIEEKEAEVRDVEEVNTEAEVEEEEATEVIEVEAEEVVSIETVRMMMASLWLETTLMIAMSISSQTIVLVEAQYMFSATAALEKLDSDTMVLRNLPLNQLVSQSQELLLLPLLLVMVLV